MVSFHETLPGRDTVIIVEMRPEFLIIVGKVVVGFEKTNSNSERISTVGKLL
jgi:hypothetical protein